MTPQKRIQITPHPRNRVALRRMCQMIWAGEVGLVLVSDASRLSRSAMDFPLFMEICRKAETLVAIDTVLMDPATLYLRESRPRPVGRSAGSVISQQEFFEIFRQIEEEFTQRKFETPREGTER